jgi:porphobilinogen deaminase
LEGAEELRLMAVVAQIEGKALIRAESSGWVKDPEELGERVAEQLLASGAGALLTGEKGIVPGAP